jgi:hypothetical protein
MHNLIRTAIFFKIHIWKSHFTKEKDWYQQPKCPSQVSILFSKPKDPIGLVSSYFLQIWS